MFHSEGSVKVFKQNAELVFNVTLACPTKTIIETDFGITIEILPYPVPTIDFTIGATGITIFVPIAATNAVSNFVWDDEQYQIDVCSDPNLYKPTISIWKAVEKDVETNSIF